LKKNLIQFLLLFSLFFNIAHATVIALEDECHHESAHEYVAEQSNSTECGDLCDVHHLFHFIAILDNHLLNEDNISRQEAFIQKVTFYVPPSPQRNIRPPIV